MEESEMVKRGFIQLISDGGIYPNLLLAEWQEQEKSSLWSGL